MERALAAYKEETQQQPKANSSPDKSGPSGPRRKRAEGAEFARLQSQIRDLQTSLSLIKRQMADSQRMAGRRGTSTGGGFSSSNTGVLLGTRCMACDNPVNVRKSMAAVPNMNHSSFQPYAAIPVSNEKKTNHPFPGRTRVMTENPVVEDMQEVDDLLVINSCFFMNWSPMSD